MHKIRSILSIIIIIIMFQVNVMAGTLNLTLDNGLDQLSEDKLKEIETLIEKNMKRGKIPGLSIVITEGDETVYEKGFGYADLKTKRLVTPDTLYEIGSNSKAFTGLGILQLEDQGLVSLDVPVSKYLPWFKLRYKGEYKGEKRDVEVDITVEQLLHHTSGIPFKSIGDIPISNNSDALEQTVKMLVGTEVVNYPGERFLYATINYDVLGLIIEKVTGMSYEEYIQENLLKTLELNDFYLFRDVARVHDLATGYKLVFFRPIAYDAPTYRGNKPAGYYIANARSVSQWMKIQLGAKKLVNFNEELINKSHVANRLVVPDLDGASYAVGWSIYQSGGGEISHGGSNPNYSSYIILRAEEKYGIAVLANLNSSYTEAIAQGISSLLQDDKPKEIVMDSYVSIDNISSIVIILTIPLICTTLYLIATVFIELLNKKRKIKNNIKDCVKKFGVLVAFLLGIGYCIDSIPKALYQGLSWNFILVWGPKTLVYAISCTSSAIALFCIYYFSSDMCVKQKDKSIFALIILNLASGCGNAMIIFIVNESFNRVDDLRIELLSFFILGIAIYVWGQKLVRMRLITIANDLVYQKREELVVKILNSSYQNIESIKDGKIQGCINNDTETISSLINVTITGMTSLVTLLCCFAYLGIINFYGLLISFIVIFIAMAFYYVVAKRSKQLWEHTRNVQNDFLKFINSLLGGFKELSINRNKGQEFKNDMLLSCKDYRDKRIEGDIGFANAFVVGELIFTFVIGVVAFAFPLIFKQMGNDTLRKYVFVFLYMTGPVNGLLDAIPNFVKIKISWDRISRLINQLELYEKSKEVDNLHINEPFEIRMEDVQYYYKAEGKQQFGVGPINLTVKSSQITFITGGNGSGKSTLAKLITGLYISDEGRISINGIEIQTQVLSEFYSAIFADFYLFEKLYGLTYEGRQEDIDQYLKMLDIDNKVQVNEGIFSTINLSTGQRKRLAMMISYLENRPICLFDEWAADQDPEFRQFFYNNLLPELKSRGKCVIAITHDDRFFDLADQVIKMEMGRIYSCHYRGVGGIAESV